MDDYTIHALTMLIMKSLDISEMTPAQVVDKYTEVEAAVRQRSQEIADEGVRWL